MTPKVRGTYGARVDRHQRDGLQHDAVRPFGPHLAKDCPALLAGPRSEEVGFAHDSALEGGVYCELVSEVGLPAPGE